MYHNDIKNTIDINAININGFQAMIKSNTNIIKKLINNNFVINNSFFKFLFIYLFFDFL
jgi:hypothetical protein